LRFYNSTRFLCKIEKTDARAIFDDELYDKVGKNV